MTTYTATATATPPAPSFTVYVTPDSDDSTPCDIEVVTADDSGFTTGIDTFTLTAQADGVAVGVACGPFVAGETKYVRARAGVSPTWSSWTTTITQVIPDGVSDGSIYIYENVGVTLVLSRDSSEYFYENVGVTLIQTRDDSRYIYEGDVNADQPYPQIWAVFPTSGRPGDGVTIYGIGFGADATTYSGVVEMLILGVWTPISVTNWILEPASVNAYNSSRTIQPDVPTIDPEHNQVDVIIPGVAFPPGHAVRVRTVGP